MSVVLWVIVIPAPVFAALALCAVRRDREYLVPNVLIFAGSLVMSFLLFFLAWVLPAR